MRALIAHLLPKLWEELESSISGLSEGSGCAPVTVENFQVGFELELEE